MTFASALVMAAGLVALLMIPLWLLSLRLRDASIVDRFWGAGFVLIAAGLLSQVQTPFPHAVILTGMVSLWGMRLSLYIHWRNRGHPEDYRYAAMRREHGSRFWWYSFFSVFALQGVLMLIVSVPVIMAVTSLQAPVWSWLLPVGFLCWLVGFVFEAGGDWQLTRFKANPANKGQLLCTGLWSVTRHPNYFGDALQWWGFGLFGLAMGPAGAATLIGPLVMTLFIRKVSGVDLLEKSLSKRKPGYDEYVARVPPFAPHWPFWGALALASLLLVLLCAKGWA